MDLIDDYSLKGAHDRLNAAFKEIDRLESQVRSVKTTANWLAAALCIVIVKIWIWS